MNIALKPEIERFIENLVDGGRFGSPADVLEEALTRMMEEEAAAEMDTRTLRAIDVSEEQIARGEYRSWKEVSRELRAKYLGRPGQ